jgi:hypothetical protein
MRRKWIRAAALRLSPFPPRKEAAIIMRRNQVKKLYDKLFGKDNSPLVLLDDKSRAEEIDKFDTAVDFLIREAAALEMLARNFRASRSI